MKKNHLKITFSLSLLFLIFSYNLSNAQQKPEKSEFWKNVQFGGGVGLGIANGNTNISIAPSAIYNFNPKFSLGAGIQYNYISWRNLYESHMYGASILGLFQPLEFIQLSAEVEQLRVNVNFDANTAAADNFWNTALFVGAGYRTNNVTIGVRYNLLHNNNNNVYTDALMPFVRVFF